MNIKILSQGIYIYIYTYMRQLPFYQVEDLIYYSIWLHSIEKILIHTGK